MHLYNIVPTGKFYFIWHRLSFSFKRKLFHSTHLAFILIVSIGSLDLIGQPQVPNHQDVVYGTIDGRDLLLDIYLPQGAHTPPLILWVHGGAWRGGNKNRIPAGFVENGFALASLDFRLSTEASFPAQVHDIKAAIRFLRSESTSLGFRVDRIAIAGASSGGHLAALVGVTNGNSNLEGAIGDHQGESSNVQAIISYFGASNLTTILNQSTPHGLSVRKPALDLFLGAQPEVVPEIAKMASPVFHVDANDPPLLLLHGDQDPQMPINQSHELEGAYLQHGLDVHFDVVYGAAHGGSQFFEGDHLQNALDFLAATIGK